MAEAKMTNQAQWESIPLVAKEINLQLTLSSGQAFRWVRLEEDVWAGTIGERLFFLRHHDNELQYQVATSTPTSSEIRQTLVDYFRLDFDLTSLYHQMYLHTDRWRSDDNFRKKALCCQGIRLLQQPPLEALLAFICSSNNHISRISTMVGSVSHWEAPQYSVYHRLCERYGRFLGRFGGHDFHSFPTIHSLVGVVSEQDLREMGFGYRARYVRESVEEVGRRGGEEWLLSLRQQPYKEAKTQLQQLSGVGSKVADCVCLMGLGHLQAVPVDVHVWRLAQRDYGVIGASSLTAAVYKSVGERFREVFGETAGWAQAVLFTAELQSQEAGREKKSVAKGKSKKTRETKEEGRAVDSVEPHCMRKAKRLKF